MLLDKWPFVLFRLFKNSLSLSLLLQLNTAFRFQHPFFGKRLSCRMDLLSKNGKQIPHINERWYNNIVMHKSWSLVSRKVCACYGFFFFFFLFSELWPNTCYHHFWQQERTFYPEIPSNMPGCRIELAILLAPHFSSETFWMRKSLAEYLSFSDSAKALCKPKPQEIHRVMNTGFLLVHFCSL